MRRPPATLPGPAAPGAQPLPVPPIALEPIALEPVALGPVVAPEPDVAPASLTTHPAPDPRPVVDAAPGPPAAPTAPAAPALEEPPRLVTPPVPLRVDAARPGNGAMPPGPRPLRHAPAPNAPIQNGAEHHDDEPADRAAASSATGPQLRRFIKSRAYVPMHELRRRFVINGGDDEVTPVDLGERRRVFVGLPEREGRLLGELLRQGDIGYELSLDPISPIVVGVYPMRPVTRA